jgi:hypothetical protein
MKKCLISFLVAGFLFLFPPAGLTSDLNLARDLLMGLEQGKRVLEQIKKNLMEGRPISAELGQFDGLTEETKAAGLLLDERFKIREEEVGAQGAIALKRHQEMAEGYRRSLQDYLALVESLSTEQVTLSRVEQIESLLERFVPKRRRPILGSLPYRNLRYPAREPSSEPTIKPAYLLIADGI